jgi:hypothetical protein
MRLFLFILGVLVAIVCIEKPAAADRPWCAYYDDQDGGFTNCGFSTYQQCLASRQNVDFVRPFSERQSAVERARRKNFRNLKKTVARSETYSFLTWHGHLLSSGCLSSSRLEKRHTSEALANSSGPLFVRSVSSPISRPPSSTRGSAFRERLLFIAFK